jgi:hypothetical protein
LLQLKNKPRNDIFQRAPFGRLKARLVEGSGRECSLAELVEAKDLEYLKWCGSLFVIVSVREAISNNKKEIASAQKQASQ